MKNEVNEVNVNLTLVFDHENLDDLYKACGIDIDKVKQFIPNLVFNCIYNFCCSSISHRAAINH